MSDELVTLWRVRRTVNEMLIDRGYILTVADVNMTLDEFKQRFPAASADRREVLTVLASHRHRHNDSIFVFWADEDKIGVKPIKKYYNRLLTG